MNNRIHDMKHYRVFSDPDETASLPAPLTHLTYFSQMRTNVVKHPGSAKVRLYGLPEHGECPQSTGSPSTSPCCSWGIPLGHRGSIRPRLDVTPGVQFREALVLGLSELPQGIPLQAPRNRCSEKCQWGFEGAHTVHQFRLLA